MKQLRSLLQGNRSGGGEKTAADHVETTQESFREATSGYAVLDQLGAGQEGQEPPCQARPDALTCSVCRSGGDDKPAVPQGPASFHCPVSMELMSDPVMVATGHSYDRSCIQKWLEQGNRTCPVTGLRLRHLELTPTIALRNAIQVSSSSSCACNPR